MSGRCSPPPHTPPLLRDGCYCRGCCLCPCSCKQIWVQEENTVANAAAEANVRSGPTSYGFFFFFVAGCGSFPDCCSTAFTQLSSFFTINPIGRPIPRASDGPSIRRPVAPMTVTPDGRPGHQCAVRQSFEAN